MPFPGVLTGLLALRAQGTATGAVTLQDLSVCRTSVISAWVSWLWASVARDPCLVCS
jgi:hypothetical protein